MGMCYCQTGRYKQHFVCFGCRKMFKKPPAAEQSEFARASTHEEYRPTCPECRQPMHNMGREFEPPRRNDVKAWREVEHSHVEIQNQSMTLPVSPRHSATEIGCAKKDRDSLLGAVVAGLING